jgi:hypothetical protein
VWLVVVVPTDQGSNPGIAPKKTPLAVLAGLLKKSIFPIPNPKQGIEVIYMGLYGPQYTWAQYTPTPPRSLNNWRSGVQDWTKREYK